MAAFEVIALDTATPQLRAPGASDTYTFPRAVELPLGTANGVLFLNGSKVVTSGSALTFDGTKAISFGDGSSATLTVPYSINGNTFTVKHGAGADTRLVFTSSGFASGNSVSFETWNGSAYNSVALSGANTAIFTLAGSEQMRLTSTGLGIGTSSPVGKLDVTGSSGTVRVETGGDALTFTNNGANYISAKGGSSGTLVFETGGATERMRLDSSGNLGLGVTPSAWGSAFKALQVGATASVAGAANASYFGLNWYNDGTNNRYIATSPAVSFGSDGDGSFVWRTAPSGTAGNVISFTQALTLTAASNLLLGGTNDPGGANAFYIANTASVPGTPTSGGVLYVESGALKYKGSSGTVTTIANA